MTVYILHYCKNLKCNNGWLDEDLFRNMRPPKWKYCPDCVEAGYVNKVPGRHTKKRTKMRELAKRRHIKKGR